MVKKIKLTLGRTAASSDGQQQWEATMSGNNDKGI